jgi:hypothetical protein
MGTHWPLDFQCLIRASTGPAALTKRCHYSKLFLRFSLGESEAVDSLTSSTPYTETGFIWTEINWDRTASPIGRLRRGGSWKNPRSFSPMLLPAPQLVPAGDSVFLELFGLLVTLPLELDSLLRDLLQLKLNGRRPLRFLGDGFAGRVTSFARWGEETASSTWLEWPLEILDTPLLLQVRFRICQINKNICKTCYPITPQQQDLVLDRDKRVSRQLKS